MSRVPLEDSARDLGDGRRDMSLSESGMMPSPQHSPPRPTPTTPIAPRAVPPRSEGATLEVSATSGRHQRSTSVVSPLSTAFTASEADLSEAASSPSSPPRRASPPPALSRDAVGASEADLGAGMVGAAFPDTPVAARPRALSTDELNPQGTLDVRRLQQWLLCFCVVNFDLELGQSLEATFPPTVFDDHQRSNICFLSFPDSNIRIGNTVFCFRTKMGTRRDQDGKVEDEFIYGYVYFRQVKDASIHRGYLQKSVVILSRHPFDGLFKKIVRLVGPLFFEYGQPLVEAACHNIARWPPPRAGDAHELPILGSVLLVNIPVASKPFLPPDARDLPAAPQQILEGGLAHQYELVASVQNVSLYTRFFAILPHLWQLWELVLIGEPILLISGSPDSCSDAVLGLISLIAPLTYCGDFRPFFTIHDTDFKEFTAEKPKLPAIILGVTNPFFSKALEHWPHVITLDNNRDNKGLNPKKAAKKPRKGSLAEGTAINSVVSTYKSLVQADAGLVKAILADKTPTGDSADQHNLLLRRHFVELTETFTMPLERYFTTLMPLAKSVSAFREIPRLKPFVATDFLATLPTSGPQLTWAKKVNWEELYIRFLQSPNFTGWFKARERQADAQLRRLYLEEVYNADVPAWVAGKKEPVVVDLVLRLREQQRVCLRCGDEGKYLARMEEHVAEILALLPPDLQESLALADASRAPSGETPAEAVTTEHTSPRTATSALGPRLGSSDEAEERRRTKGGLSARSSPAIARAKPP